MSDKQQIIQQMIAMQKKFIDIEHKDGIAPEDYFNPAEGHELDGYKQAYDELAKQLIDLAHEEKGSKR
jgi:hypothetical protein